MDPNLIHNVDTGALLIFCALLFGTPLLALFFNRSPHEEDEYVDERQGLGEIEDNWGWNGVNGRPANGRT